MKKTQTIKQQEQAFVPQFPYDMSHNEYQEILHLWNISQKDIVAFAQKHIKTIEKEIFKKPTIRDSEVYFREVKIRAAEGLINQRYGNRFIPKGVEIKPGDDPFYVTYLKVMPPNQEIWIPFLPRNENPSNQRVSQDTSFFYKNFFFYYFVVQ